MTSIDTRSTLLVDSHCHLHDISDLSTVLDHAASAFKQAAGKNNISGGWYGGLVFTDSAKSTSFSHIRYMIESSQDKLLNVDNWNLQLTADEAALTATNHVGQIIFIFAGQQIITREKLELLSILAATRIADGVTLNDGINQVTEQGGLPVLPWGVGKWLGKRGKIVTETILTNPTRPLFLGDISTRPKGWNKVSQFSLAQKNNIPILRGTDPLAVKNPEKRGGDFGFIIKGELDMNRPASSLQTLLTSSMSFQDYGELTSPIRFFSDQLAIRFKKS